MSAAVCLVLVVAGAVALGHAAPVPTDQQALANFFNTLNPYTDKEKAVIERLGFRLLPPQSLRRANAERLSFGWGQNEKARQQGGNEKANAEGISVTWSPSKEKASQQTLFGGFQGNEKANMENLPFSLGDFARTIGTVVDRANSKEGFKFQDALNIFSDIVNRVEGGEEVSVQDWSTVLNVAGAILPLLSG